nr:unnamed protein product [Callosobruchus chinensis]
MTKRRRLSVSSPVKVEIKEENTMGIDYLMAKGRLKGVLKQLIENSSDEDSDSSTDRRYSRKRKAERVPQPYHHTYVMKLFDRSVDLARFEEDTPLYPICRAWMQNQPKNPQTIVKRRVSTPEPEERSWNEDDSLTEVTRLPAPSHPFETRLPSPLPEQQQNKDNINLNYDEFEAPEKEVLMQSHLERWAKVKRKWVQTAAKNEERYAKSTEILKAIYTK